MEIEVCLLDVVISALGEVGCLAQMVFPRIGVGLRDMVVGCEVLLSTEQAQVAVDADEEPVCEVGCEAQALFAAT